MYMYTCIVVQLSISMYSLEGRYLPQSPPVVLLCERNRAHHCTCNVHSDATSQYYMSPKGGVLAEHTFIAR